MLTIWDRTHSFQLIEVSRLQQGILVVVDRTRLADYSKWTRQHLVDDTGKPPTEGCRQLLALLKELLIDSKSNGSKIFIGDYDEDTYAVNVDRILEQEWLKLLVWLAKKANTKNGRTHAKRTNYTKRRRGHAKGTGEGSAAAIGNSGG